MRVGLLAALAMPGALAALAGAPDPHGDEMRTFAATKAIGRTVRDSCLCIAPDD